MTRERVADDFCKKLAVSTSSSRIFPDGGVCFAFETLADCGEMKEAVLLLFLVSTTALVAIEESEFFMSILVLLRAGVSSDVSAMEDSGHAGLTVEIDLGEVLRYIREVALHCYACSPLVHQTLDLEQIV